VRDFDLDLANRYGTRIGARWGRETSCRLRRSGRRARRAVLASRAVPLAADDLGYLLAGLHGAIATIALFGVFCAPTVR
jgi:hypothetical protein